VRRRGRARARTEHDRDGYRDRHKCRKARHRNAATGSTIQNVGGSCGPWSGDHLLPFGLGHRRLKQFFHNVSTTRTRARERCMDTTTECGCDALVRSAVAATRVVSRLMCDRMAGLVETFEGFALRAHQWLYETTDGRVGQKIGKLPTLLLRTTGARTGQTRVAALVYGLDGDGRYVVVGSNGGSDRTPGWVHNVKADPKVEVQVGRDRKAATAEVLTDGPDYEHGWKIVNDVNRYQDGGRYEHYQTLTERRIPLVVLST
jgi:deazaflavin-dependent oxidoreductase (nitroreductase family)